LVEVTDTVWAEGQFVLPDCVVKVSWDGDTVRDGGGSGGKTVKVILKMRVLFADITSTDPLYVPAVKPTGVIEMVKVAGVTVLLSEARNHGSPVVKRVKLSGAN
jgi:hypothetical protein